jgi:hypothetical protein
LLKAELGEEWMVFDVDQVFNSQQRVMSAEMAGISSDSDEFRTGVARPAQQAFEALLRSVADTGLNVVGLAPFDNLHTKCSDGRSLWQRMIVEDFGEYDLDIQFFLVTAQSGWWDDQPEKGNAYYYDDGKYRPTCPPLLEEEIKRRLAFRARCPYQSKLDTNYQPKDYRTKVSSVLQSRDSCGRQKGVVNYPIDRPLSWLAKELRCGIRIN